MTPGRGPRQVCCALGRVEFFHPGARAFRGKIHRDCPFAGKLLPFGTVTPQENSPAKSSGCLRKALAFFAMPVLGMIGAAIATPFFPKVYVSTATIQVRNIQDPVASIQSKEVYDPIIRTLNLQERWKITEPGKIHARMREAVGVRSLRNTDVIQINVLDQDPQLAASVANAITEEFQTQRARNPDATASFVTVRERAEPGQTHVLPNIYLNLLVGLLGGLFAGVVLAIIVK